jgi:hypothetical protein
MIQTRARMGLPTSLNRRRSCWTPWHTAATALAVVSVGIITAIVAIR